MRINSRRFLPIILGILIIAFFVLSGVAVASSEQKRDSKAWAHYMMGLLYDQADDLASAIDEYKEAGRLDSESLAIHLRIAVDYIRLEKFDEAISQLKSTIGIFPDAIEPRVLLALLYASLKRFDEASLQYEEVLKKAKKLDPQNIQIYHYLGQLYYQQKKLALAIEQYKFILTIDPKDSDAHFYLGFLYEEQGKRDDAIKELRKAIELNPKHSDALNSLGYLYAENEVNLDEAISLINKALEIDPENGAYIDSLGWAYYKKGNLTEALEKLKKAAELIEDPVILDHLGDVYSKMNLKDQAKESWQKSLKLDANQQKIKEKLEKLK